MNFKVKRIAKWIGKVLGAVVAFVLVVVATALLALQTSWAQQRITQLISDQANKALKGRVEVTLDGWLSPVGFAQISVRLLPADINDNAPLAELSNVQASWDLGALVGSLLGSGPLVVGINKFEVERLLVDLRTDAEGNLALVEAVALEQPSAEEPESTGPSPFINLKGLDIFNARILLPIQPTTPADNEPPNVVGTPIDSLAAVRQAVTIDQIHAVFEMHDALSAAVTLSSIEAPIPGQGSVFLGDLGAVVYVDEDSVPTAIAALDGELQGLPVTVNGIYDNEQWLATVAVDGSAEAWQGAALGFEPTEPVAAEVLALGDLKSADVNASVTAGTAAIAAVAELAFSPVMAKGALAVQRANPRVFAAAAPPGLINLTATFSAQSEPQLANVQLALRGSELEGNPIPEFDLQAKAEGSTRVEFHLKATDDSGLELEGRVNNQPQALSFDLQGQAKRLPEYAPVPQLTAFDVRDLKLDAHGQWRNQTRVLDASLDLTVDRILIPSAKVAVADVSAHVTTAGPLTSPALDGNIGVRTLRVGDLSASKLRVQAATVGRSEPKIVATTRLWLSQDAPPRDVTLSTTVSAFSPLKAKDTLVTVASKERSLKGRTPSGRTLSVWVGEFQAAERLVANDIRLSGVGDVTGNFTSKGSTVDAALQTNALNLTALSDLFQPLVPELTGEVTSNLALKTTGQRLTSAHVFARATGVGTSQAHADALDASLVIKQNALSGTVSVVRGQSRVRVDTRDVALAALLTPPRAGVPAFSAKDFRGYIAATVLARSQDFPELEASGDIHAEGTVQSLIIVSQTDEVPLTIKSTLKLRDVDVRKAEPRVPPELTELRSFVPERRVTGQRSSDAPRSSTGAHSSDAPRSSTGQESDPTSGTTQGDADSTHRDSEWAIIGLTADWTSIYDGASGKWSNTIAASDNNRAVPFANVSFDTTLPLHQLNAEIASVISTTPIKGSVVIPLTSLNTLPGGSFMPTGVEASIAADIDFSGTVSAPRASGSLQVKDLQVSASNNSFPVSLVVDAKASKEAVDATFRLTHETLVLVTGNVKGAPASNVWRAAATIDELPLGRMPYVRDYGVTGAVSGKLAFDSGTASPSVIANIHASDVTAYGERMASVAINAKLENGKGELLTDIKQTSGHARLTAAATSSTGQLADYRPISARLEARSFAIRPLLIAMQDSVSDLSGVLDGEVEIAFSPGSTAATGSVELRDGLILIPAFGKPIHDIGVTLQAAPGELELQRLDAKVERGEIKGSGKLSYTANGRVLGEVKLELPEARRLPIASKGRDIAEASGRINVKASAGPNEETKISIDVPELDVYFSDSATDKVMSKETPAFVTLGTYLPDGHFVRYNAAKEPKVTDAEAAASTPTKPTQVTVKLSKKVWLHHGTSTFAGIYGDIQANIGTTTQLLGTLNLAEGRIDIQGRVFDIRPGTVAFHGETPPNPDVVAEAAWASPGGYTVIATYRGSVANGKVVLRSEPPLSYGEILNVLLFDDPEGSGGSDGSPGAGDVAATVASAGLSKSLTSLTDLDIQASIDTDPAGSPRPELGVRLTPRLAVEVAYVLEPSAALSQPPDKAFVSFDWRLSNAWSVEATLGDHGSAATDITWKYRY